MYFYHATIPSNPFVTGISHQRHCSPTQNALLAKHLDETSVERYVPYDEGS